MTGVVFVFSVLEIFYNISSIVQLKDVTFLKKWYPWLSSHTEQILLITLGLYAISKIVLFIIDRKEDTSASEALHTFCHDVRDKMFSISSLDVSTYENDTEGLRIFYSHVRDKAESLCRDVNSFLKAYTNKDFAVCIKLIKPTYSHQSSAKENIEIMTLCREGAKKTERSQGDFSEQIKLTENTDFAMIFDANTNIFAIHNLPLYIFQRILSKNKYKTSTKKPVSKYRSTVVTPIRIANEYLPKGLKTKATYTLIGFLCVDYKHILRRQEMKRIKNYIKSMGDSLYPFFHQVMLIDKNIRNKE